MKGLDTSRSTIDKVEFSLLPDTELYVKRDDLIHPIISGNKWRKLKYFIEDIQQQGYESFSTMGGAYSNHLIASACAGALFDLKTTGWVRGDELDPNSNAVLRICASYGMNLKFVSREEYRKIRDEGAMPSEVYFIPEGGEGDRGVKGCEEVAHETLEQETKGFDDVVVAVGTGTTLAGVARGFRTKETTVHGIAAIKGGEYLNRSISDYVSPEDFILHTKYHGGGFGKTTKDIKAVGDLFTRETGILLDPIYTQKLVFALTQMKEEFKGKRVLMIHTGGITGWLK